MLLNELNSNQKNALFALIALSLPVEPRNNLTLSQTSWSHDFLIFILKELDLPENYYEAYSMLVDSHHVHSIRERGKKMSIISPFIQVLEQNSIEMRQSILEGVISLLVVLILKNRYDTRARCLIRRLIHLILSKTENPETRYVSLFAIEDHIIHILESEFKRIADHAVLSHSQDTTKSNRSKYIRYAQIGAVSLGAGAVIALTGGLAAPAIAAVWGGFSFLTTAGVAFTLFGSAGAGLTGYKMMKRTKGLTEFSFEAPQDSKQPKSRPAVLIMVSGYMYDKEDYKRAFGIVPDELSFEERLIRFLRIHDPDKIKEGRQLAMLFSGEESMLLSQMAYTYDKDPLLRDNLMPDYSLSSIRQEYNDIISASIVSYINSMTPSKDTSIPTQAIVNLDSEIREGENEYESEVYDEDYSEDQEVGADIEDSLYNSTNSYESKQSGEKMDRLTPSCVPTESSLSDLHSFPPEIDVTKPPTISDVVNEDTAASLVLNETSSETPDLPEIQGRVLRRNSRLSDYKKQKETPQPTIEETAAFGTNVWHFRELSLSAAYEPYLLRWEVNAQLELGRNIAELLVNLGVAVATQVIAETFFYTLATAIMLPAALMSWTSVIDGVWTVAVIRADLAGKELARALIARPQGSRPVTLVGYSMGARVIFSCLCELFRLRYGDAIERTGSIKLAKSDNTGWGSMIWGNKETKKKSSVSEIADSGASQTVDGETDEPSGLDDAMYDEVSEYFDSDDVQEAQLDDSSADQKYRGIESIVQDVVLLGTPVRYKSKFWKCIRRVVVGRVINGYSSKDAVLGIIYRIQRMASAVAGVEPVLCPGIENVDLSHIVTGHLDYSKHMKDILELVNLSVSEASI